MIRDSYEYWHTGISDTVANKNNYVFVKNIHPFPHALLASNGNATRGPGYTF